MFQLHVSDSLYSQALAFSQVPSGIAFNNNKYQDTLIEQSETNRIVIYSNKAVTFKRNTLIQLPAKEVKTISSLNINENGLIQQ